MPRAARFFLVAGAVSAAIAVAAGAFGAHGLRNLDYVTPERLGTFETGARYQMIHALALLAVGLLLERRPGAPTLARAGGLFLAGSVIFSGSLYLLVLTDTGWLGAVTPIGGVAFIAGWGLLAWGVARAR